MKQLAIVACLLYSTTLAHAGASLKEARKLLQEGDYLEAREMFEELLSKLKKRYQKV